MRVAIHAPLAEGDNLRRGHEAGGDDVAIHAPLAEGDLAQLFSDPDKLLRSTPPSRRATMMRCPSPSPPRVAIHAPLAEGDPCYIEPMMIPLKVAIHAPLAEGDPAPVHIAKQCLVAIHAPLAEGDSDRCNLLERPSIEGEVREPPWFALLTGRPIKCIQPHEPRQSAFGGDRAKLPGRA